MNFVIEKVAYLIKLDRFQCRSNAYDVNARFRLFTSKLNTLKEMRSTILDFSIDKLRNQYTFFIKTKNDRQQYKRLHDKHQRFAFVSFIHVDLSKFETINV